MHRTPRTVAHRLLAALVAGALAAIAFAQDGAALPHEFAAGDVISASEMNANFDALLERVESLEDGAAGTSGSASGSIGYASVSSYAFHSGTRPYLQGSRGACIVPTPGEPDSYVGALSAPIQLPHGAEVLEVSFVYLDDGTLGDLRMSLFQHDGFDGTVDATLAEATSGGPGVTRVGVPVSGATVDNEAYSYVVSVSSTNWRCEADGDAPDENRIRQVEVKYRLP